MPIGIPIEIEITSGPIIVGNAFAITITLETTPTTDTSIQLTASDFSAISPLDDDFPLTLTVPANHDTITYWLSADATGQYDVISAPDNADLSDPNNWTAITTVPISS